MDKYTVRSSVDGSVDVNATLAAYGNALTTWISTNEIGTSEIRDAVDAAFSSHPAGTRMTIPVLVSEAMKNLDCNHTQFNAVSERIRAYVRGQDRFHSLKGKGGGVTRLYLEGETPVAPPVKKSA